METLRIGYRTEAFSPFTEVLQNLALQYGLDLQVKLTAGEAELAEERLFRGEVDLLMGQHYTPFVSKVTGTHLTWLAVAQNYRDYKLVTLPDTRSPDELKGKRVAVSPSPCLGINEMLILNRMGLEREVTVVSGPAQGYMAMLALLEDGGAEAVFVDTPLDIEARRRGLRVYEETPRLEIIAGECLTTIPSVIRERDEALRRLMKAYLHATSLIKRDKQIMREAITTKSRVKGDLQARFDPDDPALLDAFIEHWTSRWERKPYATLTALQNTHEKAIRYDPRVAPVNPITLVDTHYVKELDEAGFIDQLYQ